MSANPFARSSASFGRKASAIQSRKQTATSASERQLERTTTTTRDVEIRAVRTRSPVKHSSESRVNGKHSRDGDKIQAETEQDEVVEEPKRAQFARLILAMS